MIKKITLLLSMCLIAGFVSAQKAQRECASMDNLEYRMQQDPQLADRMAEIEAYTQLKIEELKQNRIDGDIITIPVVVHVIYSNAQENISDAQVQSQIDVLNEDFRRLNADADGTWSQAADTQIEFCLASIDENGNATNGITRKSSTRTSWGTNDAMKSSAQGGVDPWDTTKYLNMWVANIGGGILGYAQFPGGNAATDGVVMSPQYFGSSAKGTGFYLSAPFDLGRTTTHEVGHFLNLRHIWGDGNCNFDDFVADTPGSDAPNYGCAEGHVSCGTVDMVQNYMDYSDDGCMNLFTQGQTDRMRVTLLPGGVRASLGASDQCGTPPDPTCDDGIQNGDEEGVDCGGSNCPACPEPTCDDGIQNGDEEGVDCGGSSCEPCTQEPTCDDGIQNGDEEGVDCGGSSCEPCQTECTENGVTLSITFDNYPNETSWVLTDAGGATVASGGTYGSEPDGSTLTEEICLPDGCYTFTINDSFSDGICCAFGNGSYSLTSADGTVLASGGDFGASESTDFCVGEGSEPTCDDGIQNGDEEGVDCGGSACAPCEIGSIDTLNQVFFETGFEGWIDGGSDCGYYSGPRSWEGVSSVYIRDNSGTRSSVTSPSLDMSAYNQVEIEFYFYSYSMENGEDFFVSFYDGSTWTPVAAYAAGTSFNNNGFYVATVTVSANDFNFASNSAFRFTNDASNNSDLIYLDEITIKGIAFAREARISSEPRLLRSMRDSEGSFDALLYPNPVTNGVLNINTFGANEGKYRIMNLLGQTVQAGSLKERSLNVSSLQAGVYIFELNDGEEITTEKFVKQ
ncbi:M43 family zinc metalloprotease [Flavobacteriaceae bacterium M23B6Z8]